MVKNNNFVISLGGSLIVPKEGVDFRFLKKFRQLILAEIRQGRRFYLISGGGTTARSYVQAAKKIVPLTRDDLDWLGIHSTRLNAHLLRTIFREVAHPEIITDPRKKLVAKEKVVVAGGWRPGWSTDYVATVLAEKYGINKIINLSNIDFAYDKDPKKFTDAKKIKTIKWTDFRKIVGDKWDPGLNTPFDPVASKKAQGLKLTVVIMNGRNINNLRNYLHNKIFKGTVIS